MTRGEDQTQWNPEHLALARNGTDAIADHRKAHPWVYLKLRDADLRGADLSGADLSGANLSGADLRRADLSGADLRRASLIDADLRLANLIDADLSGASLSGANLSSGLCRAKLRNATLIGAVLSNADLRGADLSEAGLRGANLSGAMLNEAILRGADFERADLSGAHFSATVVSTDLTTVIGLDAIIHMGPSEVSHSVLLRPTARPWPIGFLRGCGLSDFEIEHARGIATTPIEFFSGFVSYCTKDDRFAVKLHDALQAKGIRCWLDKHEILPGDNIYRKVNEGIRLWDKLLFCASKNSIRSWWVKDELTRALEKEQKLEKERGHEVLAIVPIDMDGYLFDSECDDFEYASTLRKRHAARLSGWEKDEALFDQQVARVVAAMRSDALARPKPPPTKLG